MRNFISYPTKTYIGVPFSQPINLCGGRVPAKICPLSINWLVYGVSSSVPNMGVTVNLDALSPAPILSKIVSVYIDNTDSAIPIFVLFPDTGFVAVAQPNSTLWLPVLTKSTRCVVYGVGFVTGAIPETLVYLCDEYVSGMVDIERLFTYPQFRSSMRIPSQNIFSTGYNAPALGDQTITALFSGVISSGGQFFLSSVLPAQIGKILVINSVTMFLSANLAGAASAVIITPYLSINAQNVFECSGAVFTGAVYQGLILNVSGANVAFNFSTVLNLAGAFQFNGAGSTACTISCTIVYTVYDPLL